MKKQHILLISLLVFLFSACSNKPKEDESKYKAYPRVKSTHITHGNISKEVELNATARYLKTSVISSPVSGYIVKARVEQGQMIGHGSILYTIQTREAKALGKKSGETNGVFGIGGLDTIRSNANGYIAETYHQAGDFVTQGEKLLTMKETSSLVFVLDLPYEWNALVAKGKHVHMIFPDNTTSVGVISRISSEVDPSNQTQKVYISVKNPGKYPEGLIAKVGISIDRSKNTILLPKDAVLTNETETSYWVMKLINDSVAVKVPVKTGIISRDTVEILSPAFNNSDRILIYGNYAVPDTLRVTLTDSAR